MRHGEGAGVVFDSVLVKCPAHDRVSDAELYGRALLKEAKAHNRVHLALRDSASLGLGETTASGERQFRGDVQFRWRFTGEGKDRVLNYSLAGDNVDSQRLADAQVEVEAALRADNSPVVMAEVP